MPAGDIYHQRLFNRIEDLADASWNLALFGASPYTCNLIPSLISSPKLFLNMKNKIPFALRGRFALPDYFDRLNRVPFPAGGMATFVPFFLTMLNLLIWTSASAQSQAQEINFCGIHIQPGGGVTGQQGTVIYDRFGNTYSAEEILMQQSQGHLNCTSGIFQLNFIGSFPADEEATICQVFQDLSGLVAGGTMVQVPINIILEPMSYGGSNDLLAAGTDFFTGNCGLVNSTVLKLIRTSESDLPIGVAAGVVHIKIKPTPATTWFSLQDEQSAPINNSQFDLYTVTMHEALHILGFASRIGLNGGSITGNNIYSNWDRFLTANAGQHLIIPSSNGSSCCSAHIFNEMAFPNMPQPLNGGCGINAQFTEGTNNIAAVNNTGLIPVNNNEMANKLSHLDILCGNANYVMHPIITAGTTRRTITTAEQQILCTLGYSTTGCTQNCTTITQDDYLQQIIVLTGPGMNNPITIPFTTLLANDAVPIGATLTLCGVSAGIQVVPIGNGFQITGSMPGLQMFCYSVTGCNGTVCDQGIVRVTIVEKLINTTICSEDCNMINYGGFEQFTPSFTKYHDQISVPEFLISGPNNSVDIVVLGETGDQVLSWINNGEELGGNSELALIPLCKPIESGCTVEVSYSASVTRYYTFNSTGSSIGFYGLTAPPCPITSGAIAEPLCPGLVQICTNVQASCMDNHFFPYDAVIDNEPIDIKYFGVNLIPHTFKYTNNGTQPITHLLIYGAAKQALGFEGDHHRFFLDDLVITNSCSPQINIEPTVVQQCINGQAIIQYQVCLENQQSNQTVPVQIQANIPQIPGVSIVPGGEFNSNGVANLTLPDQDGDPNCATLTLTLSIGGNILPGTELIIGMTGASPNACLNLTQNSAEVTLHLENCTPDPQACMCPTGGTVFNIGNNAQSVTLASQTGLVAAADVLTNVCISIQGQLIWDIEGLIKASHIIMNEGAEMIVTPGWDLYLDDNLIEGCDHMWRGLTIQSGGNFRSARNRVRDAQYVITAQSKSTIRLIDNFFDRDYVGLYVPPSGNGQIQTFMDEAITGNHFICSATLKTPFAGQSPSPGNITHLAALLNDVAGLDIGAGNEADGISNGVFASRSAFTMSHCTIKNLIANTSGDLDRYGIRVENCAQATLTYNILDGVGAGIYGYNSNLTADHNQITGYATNTPNYYDYGINYSVGNNRSVRIRDNAIKAWDGGIDVSFCQSPNLLRVKRNEVEVFPADSNNGTFPGPAIILSDCNKGYISDNEMTNNGAHSFGSGMLLINCHSMDVLNNTTNNLSIGFSDLGNASNYFAGNDAVSTSANAAAANGTGFDVENSTDRFCSNYTDGQSAQGWYFLGACTPSKLICNQIGSALTGLSLWANNLDPVNPLSTLIGAQVNHGNQWVANAYPLWGAYNASIDQIAISESRFSMPAAQIPTWSTGVGQNASWFSQFTGNAINCTLSCPVPYDLDEDFHPGGGGEGEGTAGPGSDDAKTARGEHIGTGINWMSRQRLYERLLDSPSLAATDSDIQAFFSQAPGTPLGQLYAVRQQINFLLARDGYTQYVFGVLQKDMADLTGALHQLHTTGPGNDPNGWAAQIQNLQSQLKVAMQIFYRYEGWMVQQRQTGSAATNLVNAAITPPNICAQNEKSLNQLRLSNGFFLDEYQTSQAALSDVKAIADQCPIEGGLAVYEARSIYRRYHPEARWDDRNNCDSNAQQRSQPVNRQLSFAVIPNPADHFLTVLASDQVEQEIHFDLYRTTGDLITSLTLAKGSASALYSTESLPSGVYFYRLIQQGTVLQTSKIIIAH